MKDFMCKLSKLIDVKSIMTLSLTIGFLILTQQGKITGEQFLTIFTVVISFYFGSVVEKRNNAAANAEIEKEENERGM